MLRFSASLWEKTFKLHTECMLTHAYRLLRVNGTVHALTYHQVGVTGPTFTCEHYAWSRGNWVRRGTRTSDPDRPTVADLQDGHTWQKLVQPLGLRSWPTNVARLFLDVDKVHEW